MQYLQIALANTHTIMSSTTSPLRTMGSSSRHTPSKKMSKSFILFTAIATMATTMADPLEAPTCSKLGKPSAEGVTCEGSNVVGIYWMGRRLTGDIKILANLKHLKKLYLLSYNF